MSDASAAHRLVCETLDRAIAAQEAVLRQMRAHRAALDDLMDDEDAGQFDEADLIDVAAAAERFDRLPDTIRNWCRTERIGVKRGGQWRVSLRHLRARLGK